MLAGFLACAAGLDLWWPPTPFVIAFAGAAMMPMAARMLEKMGFDDATGAVSVYGVVGLWGVLSVGISASKYPVFLGDPGTVPTTGFMGQAIGAVVMFAAGFIPGYGTSLLLRMFGMLRVPRALEIAGLDIVEVPAIAYPESIPERLYGIASSGVVYGGAEGLPAMKSSD